MDTTANIDADLDNAATAVKDASSLAGLLASLQSFDKLCATAGLDAEGELEARVDFTSLPTFGGAEPTDTRQVWSWDETNILTGTCTDDLAIVPPRLRRRPASAPAGTGAAQDAG